MKRYDPNHYVVEIHLGMDVLSNDYGNDQGCADRAIERLKTRQFDELRIWHMGRCVRSVNRLAEY